VVRAGVGNEMKAGFELDAIVAKAVMNLIVRKEDYELTETHRRHLTSDIGADCVDTGMNNYNSYCPKYSTNISAAWEVVEKMKEDREPDICFNSESGGFWTVVTYNNFSGNHETMGDTAPHAIALASLKAVGYEWK